jgi:hypothetical protein
MAKAVSAKAGQSLPTGPVSPVAITGERTGTVGSTEATGVGSNYVPLTTERHTMTYILAESDFKIIAYTNTVSLAAFAGASLFFSIFVTFATGWLFTNALSPELVSLTKVVLWASGGLVIILFGVGVWNFIRRQSHVNQIKKGTRVKQ